MDKTNNEPQREFDEFSNLFSNFNGISKGITGLQQQLSDSYKSFFYEFLSNIGEKIESSTHRTNNKFKFNEQCAGIITEFSNNFKTTNGNHDINGRREDIRDNKDEIREMEDEIREMEDEISRREEAIRRREEVLRRREEVNRRREEVNRRREQSIREQEECIREQEEYIREQEEDINRQEERRGDNERGEYEIRSHTTPIEPRQLRKTTYNLIDREAGGKYKCNDGEHTKSSKEPNNGSRKKPRNNKIEVPPIKENFVGFFRFFIKDFTNRIRVQQELNESFIGRLEKLKPQW